MPAHLPGHSGTQNHDLKALAALIPLERHFPLSVVDLVELNAYAVDVRYADDWREPQLSDARRALVLASKVRAAVRELMPPSVVD
jgi:HEPN domain-containing protein